MVKALFRQCCITISTHNNQDEKGSHKRLSFQFNGFVVQRSELAAVNRKICVRVTVNPPWWYRITRYYVCLSRRGRGFDSLYHRQWGYGVTGSATALQAEGCGFDSHQFHQMPVQSETKFGSYPNKVGLIPAAGTNIGLVQWQNVGLQNRGSGFESLNRCQIGIQLNSRATGFEPVLSRCESQCPRQYVGINLKVRCLSVKQDKLEHYQHIHPNSPHRQIGIVICLSRRNLWVRAPLRWPISESSSIGGAVS